MENKNLNPDQLRQLYIIRQSQMERAIEYYTLMKTPVSTKLLINTADIFADYILNGMNESVVKRVKTLDTKVEELNTQDQESVVSIEKFLGIK